MCLILGLMCGECFLPCFLSIPDFICLLFCFRKLLTLKAGNIVRQIVVVPHGNSLVGSCDDGCYVWNISNVDEHQTRLISQFTLLMFQSHPPLHGKS